MTKYPTKDYNLGVLYPHLIDEFHPKLNDKTIYEYNPSSRQKLYWKCDKHDYYQQSAKSRSNGSGCPYCSGNKPHPKDNLKTNYPHLVKEWHPTKNKKKMEEYTDGSRQKVYWLCSTKKWGVKHTFQQVIYKRTKGNQGCPYCLGMFPSKEYNLKVIHPNIVKEWYYSKNEKKPSDYSPQSSKRVWWKCPKSDLHIYSSPISRRTGVNKTGCPFCHGKLICEDNTLSYKKPYLVKQLHPTKNGDFDPSKIYYNSVKKVWWMCSRGHEWKIGINRRIQGTNCPKCSGAQTSKFEFRLLTELQSVLGKVEHRKIIDGDEVDVYLPYYKIGIEYDGWYYHRNKIDWDKSKNKRLKKSGISIIRVREQGKTPLPKVSRNDVFHQSRKEKDIDVIKRVLVSISKIVEFSKSRWKIVDKYLKQDELWNDEKYYEYFDQLVKPPIEKSLQNTHPELLKYWHPTKNKNLIPTDISFMSVVEVWWICDKYPNHDHRRVPYAKRGCPYCTNRMVDDKNSLESLYPEVSKEFHPTKNGNLKPNEIYFRSARKIWWKCPNGLDHEFQTPVRNRIRLDKNKKIHITKCPFCIGKKVSITNCLETTHPEITKEFHPTKNGDITPRNVIYGSHKKIWFVCNKGHEWETPLYVRTGMGCGCPYCSGNQPTPENNFEVKFPTISKQIHPTLNDNIKPSNFLPFSSKKVFWVCKENNNHIWKTSFAKRGSGQNCPYCSGNKIWKEEN